MKFLSVLKKLFALFGLEMKISLKRWYFKSYVTLYRMDMCNVCSGALLSEYVSGKVKDTH